MPAAGAGVDPPDRTHQSAWEWNSPTCPRLAAPPRPPLRGRATPRVSLLRRVLLAASCCIPSAMLLGADEGEWAAVERRGPHL
ncbi:hypothetical protein Zm00014a_039186 [Zea mays]|uniref:Uncharacterized protein n=2 Tax=Zea mays TaxID=4577 RepID=A0A8J8YE42_MAIZE|nr:hypothetical protein ZEAMMB73_Zm00001d052362 [Zea mays]PWZ29156.1 hypothetical protein Zm00014a_039186 [Zea mays]